MRPWLPTLRRHFPWLSSTLLTLCSLLAAPLAFSAERPAAPPKFEWRSATPESQGLSTARLDSFWRDLKKRGTTALLVIRNDRIVFEQYAGEQAVDKPHYTASMAKALVGGVSLMLAMNDGLIDPDDLACKYIPQWKGDPKKSKITIRQLATHTSGVSDAEQDDIPHNKLTGWKGDFWNRKPDPFTISRDKAPVIFDPGTSFSYSNPGMAMLSYAVTASLKEAPVKDIRTLIKTRIMDPIGVPPNEWSIGYGTTYNIDGLPLVANWGGGGYTARATARVGRLMLRGGEWEGVQLVESPIVERVTREGLAWWANQRPDGSLRLKAAPRDAFWGAGAGHQVLFVVPSLNLICVRNGGTLDSSIDYDAARDRYLLTPLMETLEPQAASAPASETAKPPYPPSPAIKSIHWAPAASIRRDAKDSDNWPLTWADDDALYGAYGDGTGFAPKLKGKVSLGIAKITGMPPDFKGENVRTNIEAKGDGRNGPKASGLLMVDGALYLLARNRGNSQVAWSADHGKTWVWCDWKFTESFGHPTFLNFGKNYAGSRDRYVYVYSDDDGDAYVPADRFVLARVPRDKIRERAAYEFFRKLGEDGQPLWSKNIRDRGAVFTAPGWCYRSLISYNPALKRYLWCQVLPGSRHPQGPRFEGGFGVFDAPEPWGPWTTVFFTPAWDVGPGEMSGFPTKWISPDGKRLHLVFSGDDSFSVRAAELTLRSQ